MHRHVTLCGDAATLGRLAQDYRGIDAVISVSLSRGVSLKPEGDLLEVYVLNLGADQVLELAAEAVREGKIILKLSEATAFLQKGKQHAIEHDADEALWEEMETGLRNQGRVSVNYLVLMGLGAVVAACAAPADAVPAAIGFVAASIIAPAFDPLAKISLGIALRRWKVAARGLLSVTVGYAVVIAVAALTARVLLAAGVTDAGTLAQKPELRFLSDFGIASVLTSCAAAIAGMLMVLSLRDAFVVGPLIALTIIPAMTYGGMLLGAGRFGESLPVLGRLGLDVVVVVTLGIGAFLWKQARAHRRSPII